MLKKEQNLRISNRLATFNNLVVALYTGHLDAPAFQKSCISERLASVNNSQQWYICRSLYRFHQMYLNHVTRLYVMGGQTCLMKEPHTIKLRCFRASRHEQNLLIRFCYKHILTKLLRKY